MKNREIGRVRKKERERQRQTDRERQREKRRERKIYIYIYIYIEREREREREREKEREREFESSASTKGYIIRNASPFYREVMSRDTGITQKQPEPKTFFVLEYINYISIIISLIFSVVLIF